jgi:copper ion binding protein
MSPQYIKSTFPIKGLPTLGCGNAEKALLELRGVKAVKASYANNAVTVEYDASAIGPRDMARALARAGYTLELREDVPAARDPGNDRQQSQRRQDGVVRITLGVKGMSCSGCEAKIERILLRMNGVKQAKASFSGNTVTVTYDRDAVDTDAMAAALAKAGYTLQTGKRPAENKNKKFNVNQFIGVAIILFAAYFIISKTVGFNFIPDIDKTTSYGVLFLVGLLTSLHCVAMCGGINMSQCIAKNGGEAPGAAAKLRPGLLYNAGRVISYTVIGGIVGALGSVVSFSGWARGIVAVLAGLFMILMGISMLGIFPWLNKITPRMPRFLRSKAGEAGKGKGPFIVGLLNGLMPCGPLQAMQLYALGTGSFFAGALSMFLFSLGTVPLMFGLGALSSILSHKFTARMMKVSAALVLFLGLVMVSRGFAPAGVNLLPAAPPGSSSGAQSASIQKTSAGDVQTVTSKLTSGGYPVITVQKGIPVQWNLQADARDLNGCNRTLVIPEYDKQVDLKAGDNIIEFTPEKTGTIPYSCWMGMIAGRIVVVDGPVAASSAQPAASTQAPSNASSGSSALFGGCCGSSTAAQFAGGKIPTDQITIAKTVDGVQEVTITVNDQGYTPAVAVVQKGIKTKIKFVAEKINSCDGYVYFPDFGGGLDLSAGELETPELTPEQDFTFECGMGMLHGYIKVVTDINNIDPDAIRREVSAWTPPAGSGGCCG